MTAVYSKPTSIPRWADTSLNVTEPSSGKKDEGWLVGEKGISSWENWRAKLVGSWFKWINERFADGATKDILRIYNPENAQKILELGQPAGVSQLFSGSGSPGPVRIWTNVDDGTQDDASFNVYYLLHKLYFESSKTGGGNEKEYFHLAPTGSNQLSSTRQAIKCAADLIDNGGSIGAAGDRWAKIYHEVPWLYAFTDGWGTQLNTDGWKHITPIQDHVEGTHTGANNQSFLTDSTACFPVKGLIGMTLVNKTKGESTTITDNTLTTISGTLSGGADWDTNDEYRITSGANWGWTHNGGDNSWSPNKKGLYLLNWSVSVLCEAIMWGFDIRVTINDVVDPKTLRKCRSVTQHLSDVTFAQLVWLDSSDKVVLEGYCEVLGDEWNVLSTALAAHLVRDEL